MEFRLLGPLEVVSRDQSLLVGGGKRRSLLAILLMHANEVVSSERLIDELWGERPPATAAKTVQVYVSNLRKALGDGVLVTRGGGYVLQTEPAQVDVDRFRMLVAGGRASLRERLRGQLMLALYRSGRQAGALEVYGEARRVLSDDLGLEPGEDLKRLHQAILEHDPRLDLARKEPTWAGGADGAAVAGAAK